MNSSGVEPERWRFEREPDWPRFTQEIIAAVPFKLTYSFRIGEEYRFVIEHLHKEGADIFRKYKDKDGQIELIEILLISKGLTQFYDGWTIEVSRDIRNMPAAIGGLRFSPLLGVDWYLRLSKELEGTTVEYSEKGFPTIIKRGGQVVVEFGAPQELVKGLFVPSHLTTPHHNIVVEFNKSGLLTIPDDSLFTIPKGLASELKDLDTGATIQLK